MNSLNRAKNHSVNQQGAALLIAMIMIFMLSVMGVSSMRNSTLERRMAANSVQTATTFQGAESASELAINDDNNLLLALDIANSAAVNNGQLNNTSTINVSVDLKQQIGLESDAVLRYVGDGPAYGYSIDFVAYRFEVEGRAKIDAVRTSAEVTQGAYRIAPGR